MEDRKLEKIVEIIKEIEFRASKNSIQGVSPQIHYGLYKQSMTLTWDTKGWAQHVDIRIEINDNLKPEVTVNASTTERGVISATAFADLYAKVVSVAASLEIYAHELCKFALSITLGE